MIILIAVVFYAALAHLQGTLLATLFSHITFSGRLSAQTIEPSRLQVHNGRPSWYAIWSPRPFAPPRLFSALLAIILVRTVPVVAFVRPRKQQRLQVWSWHGWPSLHLLYRSRWAMCPLEKASRATRRSVCRRRDHGRCADAGLLCCGKQVTIFISAENGF
jgi:hypothetical protein